jgi:uncharacterized glyoxalase superfamily protein PhnB
MSETTTKDNITKLTPVRIVDAVEPCLAFWRDALGYEIRAEVPHGGATGFALLENAAGELMLQSKASLADDLPAVAALAPDAVLFVEVRSLDAAKAAIRGATVLVADRTTFYGMRETVVQDPGGTVVIFAEPV